MFEISLYLYRFTKVRAVNIFACLRRGEGRGKKESCEARIELIYEFECEDVRTKTKAK